MTTDFLHPFLRSFKGGLRLCLGGFLALAVFAHPAMGEGIVLDDDERINYATSYVLFLPDPAQQAVCARVRIEISQDLAFERQGFEARMTIRNGLENATLTNVKAVIHFTDEEGNPVLATLSATDPDPDAKFFYRSNDPENDIVEGVLESADVPPKTDAGLRWLIIPRADEENTTPQGILYYVGATLSYTVAGKEEVVHVSPDYIRVRPTPILEIEYFLPHDVEGDDPLTYMKEPVVPFVMGIRIKNKGHADAPNLKIDSAQPKILRNDTNALAGFEILGSFVGEKPASASLLLDFGTVPAESTAVGFWTMSSDLMGTFTEFEAVSSHSDLMGGETTSLLDPTEPVTHSLLKDVVVDLPGRDSIRDFLVRDEDELMVYESDSGAADAMVSDVSDSATSSQTTGQMLIGTGGAILASTFFYIKARDMTGPSRLTQVVRSDGKVFRANNFWTSKEKQSSGEWFHYVNLFDFNNKGASSPFSYVVGMDNVTSIDYPPLFQRYASRFVKPGQHVQIDLRASDPNGQPVTMACALKPAGSAFTDEGGGVGRFSWTPPSGTAAVGSHAVKVTASDGTLTASATLKVVVTAISFLEEWKEQYWPGVTDPAIIGNHADPDGDGFANLYEYALGMDPTRSSLGQAPRISKEESGGKHYLVYTYVGRTDDEDLTIEVLGSGTAAAAEGSWTVQTGSQTISQEGVPSGFQRFKIRDGVALEDSATGRFLRLRVSLEP